MLSYGAAYLGAFSQFECCQILGGYIDCTFYNYQQKTYKWKLL